MIEPLENRIAPAALVSVFQVPNGESAHGGNSLAAVATDSQGDIIIAGVFFKSINVDPAGTHLLTTSDPAGDLYIAIYSPAGALLWATTWGGTGPEGVSGIAVDGSGNIFLTGTFSSANAGFGGAGTLSAVGDSDVFLLKLLGATGAPDTAFNSTGELRWGGTDTESGNPEVGYSVTVAPTIGANGAVVVAGAFSSPDAGFGGASPTISSAGQSDAFAFEVDDNSGAPITAFGTGGMISLGGPNNDFFTRVVADGNGNLFFAYLSNQTNNSGTANVVKVSATDGAVSSTFGIGGIAPLPLSPGVLSAQGMDLALDNQGNIIAVQSSGSETDVFRLDPGSGSPLPPFGPNGEVVLKIASKPNYLRISVDSQNQVYVTGETNTASNGAFVSILNSEGSPIHTSILGGVQLISTLDPNGLLILRGIYSGNVNLDPTGGVFHLTPPSAATLGANMSAGFIERIDPYAFTSAQPFTYLDDDGNTVVITLTGPGYATYQFDAFQDLQDLDLFNTTLATSVDFEITAKSDGPSFVFHIATQAPDQDVGSITLGADIDLGDGAVDTSPALQVSGQLNSLTLDGINQDAVIELGNGLPAAATLHNHPNITIGDILGPGVQIDVLGDAAQDGLGGGGLGNVLIHSWNFPGLIQTTQSIGNFTVEQQDFLGVLMVGSSAPPAPFLLHPGHQTTPADDANVGNMTIENGAWGSSGSEIQGNIESFDATAFLAGASIQAGSIGTIKMTSGQFAGTLMLTDAGAAAAGTFTVDSDFTGDVISDQPLKKINIKGNFTGSLSAPGIASITAYAFLGTAPANPTDPLTNNITVTDGVLGAIKSTAGIVEYYDLNTPDNFTGLSVNVSNLTQSTIGIEDVDITAASIGNISVHLAAAKAASNIDLTGIDGSSFTTTGAGTVKGTLGSIGNIAVTLTGNAGVTTSTGINNSGFDARVSSTTVNPLGKIAVKLTGAGGTSLGLDTVTFAGNSIGTTSLSVTPGRNGTATALDNVTYTADKTIGGISISGDSTLAAADDLNVWAGGLVGPISISSKTATAGSLIGSSILAGQDLSFTGVTEDKTALALLRGAALGTLTLSGSLSGTTIAAGSNLGAVTIGGTVDTSYLLAGSLLGAEHELGQPDDSFQRAAAIASVTVKGAFTSTTIAAGIDPMANGFGDADDTLGAQAGPLTQSSQIGVVSLGGGTLLTAPTMTHQYAIEAAAIKKLILPQTAPVTSFTAPVLIDVDGGSEDAADILVRLITS